MYQIMLTGVSCGSLPSRGAWIEISASGRVVTIMGMSLPSRGAWIEIKIPFLKDLRLYVAPLAGGVD